MTYKVVLLRHGQSVWNQENLFTGWVDVPLTEQGTKEAAAAADFLTQHDVLPDVVHTSLLRRAIDTANITLGGCDRHWIPVKRHWRLNERHYGALQGKNKKEVLAEHGEDQFMQWRRSYSTPPPAIDPSNEHAQTGDPRYANLGPLLPATECLENVLTRMVPYWHDEIVPDLIAGKTVLITAHGNSLRALVKYLDEMSEEDVVALNIPTGSPLVYELNDDFTPITPGGQYLDPGAAEAAAKVANQGR